MTDQGPAPTDANDPGSPEDGKLAEVLDTYLAEVEAGHLVDVEALIAAHPAIAGRLRDCLGVLQAVGQVADPDAAGPLSEAGQGWGPLGDYRVLRQVGRGGMGIVYEAEQVSLGRRVALKILPFASALDPPQLARFRLEAQAAAQLHHANIVPIHAIGTERGVHFYAMQFIDGRTLEEWIGDLRRSGADAKTPPPDSTPLDALPGATTPSIRGRAHLRTAAELGIQAAEALDHAHRMGIVHRDVKPANLILDGRGHLWITDFGLARVQSNPGLTSTGNVLGTLRYMSPEQALARRDIVDHRADIYSLGATLYELMTLRPIFGGEDRAELLLRIERDEPRPPRRLNPSIPTDLETIVLKALAKEPSQRYATAKDLADDLRRHLDHRPIHARRPTPWQRVTKWVRRHQAATASAGAALLISLVVLSVALTLIARKQKELERQRDEARAQRELARRAVDRMYTGVAESWLAGRPRLETVRREFLEEALRFYEDFAREPGTDPSVRRATAEAYRRVGHIRFKLGSPREAEAAFRRSLEIYEELLTGSPDRSEDQSALAATLTWFAQTLESLDRLEEAEAAERRALDLAVRLTDQDGTRPTWLRLRADCYKELGFLLARSGRLAEAKDTYDRALPDYERLVAEHPDQGNPHQTLANFQNIRGHLFRDLGSLDEAEAAYRHALREALVPDERSPVPADLRELRIYIRNNLGVVLMQTGRLREAEEAFRRAITDQEALAADFPGVPDYRDELALNLSNLGALLRSDGRTPEAEPLYRRAVALEDALVKAHPSSVEYLSDRASLLRNLGNLLRATRRLPDAEAAYRSATGSLEMLSDDTAQVAGLIVKGKALYTLASLLSETGRHAEAVSVYLRSLKTLERLAVRSPGHTEVRSDLTLVRNELSWLLATSPAPEVRDPTRAVALAERAVELMPRAGGCWNALGLARYRTGDCRGAIEALEKSMELRSGGDAFDWVVLAMAHHGQGEEARARIWYDKAVARIEADRTTDEVLRRLRTEASALLGSKSNGSSTAQEAITTPIPKP